MIDRWSFSLPVSIAIELAFVPRVDHLDSVRGAWCLRPTTTHRRGVGFVDFSSTVHHQCALRGNIIDYIPLALAFIRAHVLAIQSSTIDGDRSREPLHNLKLGAVQTCIALVACVKRCLANLGQLGGIQPRAPSQANLCRPACPTFHGLAALEAVQWCGRAIHIARAEGLCRRGGRRVGQQVQGSDAGLRNDAAQRSTSYARELPGGLCDKDGPLAVSLPAQYEMLSMVPAKHLASTAAARRLDGCGIVLPKVRTTSELHRRTKLIPQAMRAVVVTSFTGQVSTGKGDPRAIIEVPPVEDQVAVNTEDGIVGLPWHLWLDVLEQVAATCHHLAPRVQVLKVLLQSAAMLQELPHLHGFTTTVDVPHDRDKVGAVLEDFLVLEVHIKGKIGRAYVDIVVPLGTPPEHVPV
mmetsp:Transcript_9389/g.29116  ORF Transcript_9389/g.29116 Transcript_9389/m.29116 type:complete len:409 (-) Transcript_9389:424-1650(-)